MRAPDKNILTGTVHATENCTMKPNTYTKCGRIRNYILILDRSSIPKEAIDYLRSKQGINLKSSTVQLNTISTLSKIMASSLGQQMAWLKTQFQSNDPKCHNSGLTLDTAWEQQILLNTAYQLSNIITVGLLS